MHLKAIRIKEQLLGPNDHEVGLSVGHLASLYNYHMNRYRDAEKLYHRSIEISKYIDSTDSIKFTINLSSFNLLLYNRFEIVWQKLQWLRVRLSRPFKCLHKIK